MRWPTGARWLQPSALDLLKDTPIDSLVVTFSAAGQELKPLLDEARRRGIALVALIDGLAGLAAARAAGFDAIASPQAAQGVIPWTPRAGMPRDSAAPVLAVTGSVWPSVRTSNTERWAGGSGAAAAEAGPTGVPWVDSNGWFVQMARVLAPGKGIWIVAEPPAKLTNLRAETYALAVADAAAYGGRWVVTLDEAFASSLSAADAPALADWRALAAALRFFSAHHEWSTYRPLSALGILSDFHGDNEFLSTEILNLISRRQVPFRVLANSAQGAGSLEGLKAVIYADRELPAPPLRKQLLAFVQAGGLLVCPKGSASLASGPAVQGAHGRFQVYTMGSGRIAVSTQDQMDPFVCAGDAHILLGRRQDLIRIWNPGASSSYYASPAAGRGNALLQLLSYTRRPVSDMSVQLAHPWRSARFWTLGAQQAQAVDLIKKPAGVEVHIPPFAVFCALELEG
jgi:hypothetical protein